MEHANKLCAIRDINIIILKENIPLCFVNYVPWLKTIFILKSNNISIIKTVVLTASLLVRNKNYSFFHNYFWNKIY
jgi:hypothetical protein